MDKGTVYVRDAGSDMIPQDNQQEQLSHPPFSLVRKNSVVSLNVQQEYNPDEETIMLGRQRGIAGLLWEQALAKTPQDALAEVTILYPVHRVPGTYA